jgi:outer membrane receptor protein involved in Fe transport
MLVHRRLAASRVVAVLATCCVAAGTLTAQVPPPPVVTGQVVVQETGAPLAGALVSLEGTRFAALTGSEGRFRLEGVPPGPQVLRVSMLGYATARIPLTVAPGAVLQQDVRMAVSALQVEGVLITADPVGRARGELGTATVIDRAAIQYQTATSLAGILELVPGVPIRPPGIDGVQQISLRTVPTAGLGPDAPGPGTGDLASAGTLIVLDGVPLSNNANLQTLGPRGELPVPSSAGGGIDLRRIPAAMLDRVEVIRGVPSARFGDLSQGAIIVDTRAGVVEPELLLRRDEQTSQVGFGAGMELGSAQTATAFVDITRTLLAPGQREDHAVRTATQLSHRIVMGGSGRATLDSRVEVFRLIRDVPEIEELNLGASSSSRDSGLRISERFRIESDGGARWEVTASLDRQWQRSFRKQERQRSALPFTDRLDDGRSVGRFIGGPYLAQVQVDGDPWFAFGRVEHARPFQRFGADHELHAGLEVRREWNSGEGYQFDMEFPPQVTFNGVQGFDRPRRFADLPAMATTTLYLDDRMTWRAAGGRHVSLQAGLRVDMLHENGTWFAGVRDLAAQPRINLELAPSEGIRVRAGWGATAKLPSVGQLSPAPQFHDIVNVNWFTTDPAERLAVLTTTVLDASNPELAMARGYKSEVGLEMGLGRRGGLSVLAFDDRIEGGIGLRRDPTHLVRDLFQLSDSTFGTGRPPEIVEPPFRSELIPLLLLRPDNMVDLRTWGIEATLALPEVRALRTRFDLQAAWIRTETRATGIEVIGSQFEFFQLNAERERTPYWNRSESTGGRLLLNYRMVYQEPAVGLAVTAAVQHSAREHVQRFADTDSLSFQGYVTRSGELVPVPVSARSQPEFADLRMERNVITERRTTMPDWLLSVQVAKTLPRDGRLAFFAFNLLDRVGRESSGPTTVARSHPPMRFGLELTLVPGAFLR